MCSAELFGVLGVHWVRESCKGAGRGVVQPGEQYGGAAAGQLAAGVPGDDRSFGTGLGETCPLPVTSIAR